jgi:delta 1-pyrroline-5-carboxylate dehydrogenase
VIVFCFVGNEKDVDNAVQSAYKAFDSWSTTTPQQRIEFIQKFVNVRAVFSFFRNLNHPTDKTTKRD